MVAEYIDHMGSDLSVVNLAKLSLSKTNQRTIEAYERGYRVTDDGKLIGVKGEVKLNLYGKQRYPTFSTNWGGYVYGVPVHKLAGYCFYGLKAFEKGITIRHLNGNVLDISKSNIALGSLSENIRDIPKDVRINKARKARASQGIIPNNAKLNPKQVNEIRDFYTQLNGRKAPNGAIRKLSQEYGVSRTVLHKIKVGEYYASITH